MIKVTRALLKGFESFYNTQIRIGVEQKILQDAVNELYAAEKAAGVETAAFRVAGDAVADHENAVANDAAIAAFKAAGNRIPSYPLHTNKMEIITGHTAEVFSEPPKVQALLEGAVEVDNKPALPDISVNPTSYWGTSAPTFYSNELLSAYMSLKSANDLGHSGLLLRFTSAAYGAPIPEGLELRGRYVVDAPEGKEYAFPHSGFAFGGSRVPSSIFTDTGVIPHDTSSWASHILGLDHSFTTLDLLYVHRVLSGVEAGKHVTWNGPEKAELTAKFRIVGLDELQPGDMIFTRFFDEGADKATTDGKPGPAAIVCSARNGDKVKGMSMNRDMPQMEGTVIKDFDLANPKAFVGAFRLIDDSSITFDHVLGHLLGEYVPDLQTLWSNIEAALTGEGGAGHGGSAASGE